MPQCFLCPVFYIFWDSMIPFDFKSNLTTEISDFSKLQHLASYVSCHHAMAYDNDIVFWGVISSDPGILFTVGIMYILKKMSVPDNWCGVLLFVRTQKSQISDFAAHGEFASLLNKTIWKFNNLLANLALSGLSNTLTACGYVSKMEETEFSWIIDLIC